MKYFSVAVILLTVLLLGSCASVKLNIPSEGRRINSDFTGIVHAGSTNTEKEYEYLNYMGVSWVLQTFYWDDIEDQQGSWNFQNYDILVDNANSSSLKVLGILAYDNKWIHPDQKTHNYIPPERMPDFLNYVRRTVEHFNGRVDAWCIWNEPNHSRFWKGTIEEFTYLTCQTAIAVREVNSDVILLCGAFNRNILGLPKKMIKCLFESGAMEKVDAVAFHPYELNANRTNKLNEKFSRIADKYGFGDRIWITEVGYPTGGWYPTKVSEKNFSARIIKTFTLLSANGVNELFWYQMFDPVQRSGSSEDYFGLFRSSYDYTSKGAEALRLCAVYFSDSVLFDYTAGQNNLPDSLKVFWLKRKDGGAIVLWKDGLGYTQINISIPGINRFQHDIETGKTTLLDSDIVIRAGSKPFFITWQNNPDSLEEEKPAVRGRR